MIADVGEMVQIIDGARSAYPGSGLGLAMAEHLMSAQGGQVSLTNRTPQGLGVQVHLRRTRLMRTAARR
jgi:signal transduction histidine kinase